MTDTTTWGRTLGHAVEATTPPARPLTAIEADRRAHPTTLHERVAAAPWCSCNNAPAEVGACCDHMPSDPPPALVALMRGPRAVSDINPAPPAFNPGNPEQMVGWLACQAQAVSLGLHLARLEAGAVGSSLQWQGGVAALRGAILAMRPTAPATTTKEIEA